MTDTTATSVEDPRELGNIVQRWDEELKAYERATKTWAEDAKRIVKRYMLRDRSVDPHAYDAPQFNVLWSNVQTQAPSLFSRAPSPMVERRFRDRDIVGRLASQILERAVSTDLEMDEITAIFKQVTLDILLCGRGLPWVRYEADIAKTEMQVTPVFDGQFIDPQGNPVEGGAEQREDGTFVAVTEEVVRERAPVEYVYWEDFYHKPVKSWEEMEKDGWVARRVYMTLAQGVKRFGRIFNQVPLTALPESMKDVPDSVAPLVKLAEVFEIWDAAKREVIWICRDYKQGPLDRKPDPLKLEKFFPCPRPAYATLANDSLVPIPDYRQYEYLSQELDDLTERISILTKVLRVRGIYDASLSGLGRVLSDTGADNNLYGIENLAAYLSKGATGTTIQNVVQFFPIDMIANVLVSLHDARERVKQTLFEVSGISDIFRGQVDPREKLGQSRIKGQFATLRLETGRTSIARVARDTIRIKAEIIAEQFDDKILREISGFDQLPEIAELLRDPQGQTQAEQLFQAAVELIRDDKLRGFRIDIETDSTVALDEQEAKQSRVEFLGAAGQFLQQALPVAQQVPQLAPLMGEIMLFAVRGFKAGRTLESAFEQAVEDLKNQAQQAQQPQEPQPDPEVERRKVELEAKKAGAVIDIQSKQQQAQLKAAEGQQKLAVKGQELGLKAQEIELRRQAMESESEENE